jgi:stringent starvation protein B
MMGHAENSYITWFACMFEQLHSVFFGGCKRISVPVEYRYGLFGKEKGRRGGGVKGEQEEKEEEEEEEEEEAQEEVKGRV